MAKTPAKQGQAPGTGNGGIIPPAEHQFKPGQSGNPAGPPRVKTQLYRHIQKFLEMGPAKLDKLDVNKMTMSQRAAFETVKRIGKGEWKRIKEIIDREEGKVPDKIHVSGGENEPIKIVQIDESKL